MKDGFYNLTEAEYRPAEGVNASFLKDGASSWVKAKFKRDNPQEPTPAMILGTRVHRAVFEPDADTGYVVAPRGLDGRTKEGKAWKEANPVYVSQDENATITGISKAVFESPEASKLVKLPGRREVSAFVTDPETGLLLKARFDLLPDGANFIVDLKTTVCARLHEWSRDCAIYGYAIQASFYIKVARLLG